MSKKRQLLIDTAFKLFNQHGYHATGIDWILNESRVSKATLYKHFRSKDELILAVLKDRHESLEAHLEYAVLAEQEKGGVAILALFDALQQWFSNDDFYGCNFIKAGAEFAQFNDEIFHCASEHKRSLRDLITRHLPGRNSKRKDELTKQLAMLFDGAIVFSFMQQDVSAAYTAKQSAALLIEIYEASLTS